MDSSLKIDQYEIKQVVLKTIKSNRSTTLDTLLNALSIKYPNVNTIHLRYKLSKVMREMKNENVIQEIEKHRIHVGQNVFQWAQNVCILDLSIIQSLKLLDNILEKM